ncbi:MAG: hypothetical protein ACRDHN_15305 [Thermomicrobiales bacterium]
MSSTSERSDWIETMVARRQRTASPGASVSNEPLDPTGEELLNNAHLRLWMFQSPEETPEAEPDGRLFSSRNRKFLALALILVVIAWYTRVILVSTF